MLLFNSVGIWYDSLITKRVYFFAHTDPDNHIDVPVIIMDSKCEPAFSELQLKEGLGRVANITGPRLLPQIPRYGIFYDYAYKQGISIIKYPVCIWNMPATLTVDTDPMVRQGFIFIHI